MISDDSTTPVSAIMTLFRAGDIQFRSVEEVVKTRIKAGKKRGRSKNTHTERGTRALE